MKYFLIDDGYPSIYEGPTIDESPDLEFIQNLINERLNNGGDIKDMTLIQGKELGLKEVERVREVQIDMGR